MCYANFAPVDETFGVRTSKLGRQYQLLLDLKTENDLKKC